MRFERYDVLTLEQCEVWARRIGVLGALAESLMVLRGVSHAWRRPKGRIVGRAYERLSLPMYLGMVMETLVGLGALILLWRPIPLRLSRPQRAVALVLGSVLYAAGFGFVIWGRIALGKMYNVSTEVGAELFAHHRLVTSGPFALVRHPMYLGAAVQFLGGVLLYRTWSVVLLLAEEVATNLGRARREEQALAAEFGPEWQAYARLVPTGLPFVAAHTKPAS
ncbi:MAG TPA: isoprenylcysteine carboxylmethyltransferase family protein [Mycobacterium sp.]|nr:isoprenylcysteine carboxylmethyltransferase family protein [Mycobacterium sp.]